MLKKLLLVLFLGHLTTAATAFELVDSQGKRHSLAGYKGKWVLVNYWATWCPPCLHELPDLAALHKDKKNNLVVLGVALEYQDPSEVLSFAKARKLPFPIILGDKQPIEQVGPVRGLPTTYLFNPRGTQVAYNVGALTREAVVAYISDPKNAAK